MTKRTTTAGISVRDLHLSFGNTKVLTGVNLEIKAGEFFAFLGPSGSGKSTLLRAIAGFGPDPVGEIKVGDRNLSGLPPWERNVGMVFQSYALWPHMSVRKNVAFGLVEKKIPTKQIDDKVEAALSLVGLLDYAERMPSQLSGGERQRAAIARALVMQPDCILADEPTGNLDEKTAQSVMDMFLEQNQANNTALILVTHDMAVAEQMQKIYELKLGDLHPYSGE